VSQFSKYVGLDVHKETIAVAVAVAMEVRCDSSARSAIRTKLYRRWPTSLAKQTLSSHFAMKRAPEVTTFTDSCGHWVQDGAEEALPDLTRAREGTMYLLLQSKQGLLAFLLHYCKRISGKSNWTKAHYRWMEEI
jgi:hypothetical protein